MHVCPNKTAKITADKWIGYDPISKDYDITQVKSEGGKNFILYHLPLEFTVK